MTQVIGCFILLIFMNILCYSLPDFGMGLVVMIVLWVLKVRPFSLHCASLPVGLFNIIIYNDFFFAENKDD